MLAGLDGGVENRTGKLVKVSQIPGVRPTGTVTPDDSRGK